MEQSKIIDTLETYHSAGRAADGTTLFDLLKKVLVEIET